MTQHDTIPWELGSDFEWPQTNVLTGQQATPWASSSENVLYLESGRQALALVSSHLKSRGFTNLVMPEHYCASMLDPFLRDGWNVTYVRMGRGWRCVSPDVALTDAARTLVFSVPLFGVQESTEWLDFLKEARSSGAQVLSDETHRLLEPTRVEADFRMGSLRKLLPVPDGGRCSSASPPSCHRLGTALWARLWFGTTQRFSWRPRTQRRAGRVCRGAAVRASARRTRPASPRNSRQSGLAISTEGPLFVSSTSRP